MKPRRLPSVLEALPSPPAIPGRRRGARATSPGANRSRNQSAETWAPASRLLRRAVLVLGLTWPVLTHAAAPAPRDTPTPPARAVRIRPDYTDLVIPPNIAPLNFMIETPATRHRLRIHGAAGRPIELKAGRDGVVTIPRPAWNALLEANRGDAIQFDIFSQSGAGAWESFAPLTNRVAREPVDRTLAYRLLKPLFNYYAELGIYQRDLESYRQTPILKNTDFGAGCLNCHTFLEHRPDTFALHIRGQSKGPQPMLLVRSNEVARVDKTAGYLSWHPSGQLLAFSANRLSLFFHTQGETRDVFDAESNLGIYWVSSNLVTTPSAIAQPERLETWPHWAPDGRHLYFCSARKLRWERYRQVRYDLMRVRFDPEQHTFGEPETVVAAADAGLSAAQPRVSPDGRWLLFCLAKYGHFPIYQPSSDLYLMDLASREYRRLEINSDQADTWHCWSSNGRWVVFSSKRGNGLFARPHFTYVDESGRFHKPFVLPQRDPAFYDACVQTFNLPELVTGPITVRRADLAGAVLAPRQVLRPSDDTRQQHNEEQAGAPRP